jgi:hypothetical protein
MPGTSAPLIDRAPLASWADFDAHSSRGGRRILAYLGAERLRPERGIEVLPEHGLG